SDSRQHRFPSRLNSLRKNRLCVGTSVAKATIAVAEEVSVQRADVEQIARMVVRDYALPFKLNAVWVDRPGQCTVGFSDAYSGAAVCVEVWCDGKVSAYTVRE